MASFLAELKKYRFLLTVAGVVLAIVVGENLIFQNPVTLSKIDEVEAGTDTTVTAGGNPNETLSLILIQPDSNEVEFTADTNAQGKAKIVLAGTNLQIVGDYTLYAGHSSKKASDVEESFTVTAGEASLTTSKVSFSQNSLKKGQTAQMVILLKDAYGNPVSGHSLIITPDQSSVEVYTSEFATNEKGHISYSVTGSGVGIVNFSIFDSTEGQNVLGQTQMAFAESNGNENQSISLAENGPITSFTISGLSSETLASQQESLTVKAVDSQGFSVSDYTGTIRFSSSDNEASLPEDYTFLADDQGEHTFSLSVKLITPGTQTISVTDIDQSTLTGSGITSVVTTLDSTSNTDSSYNSDFETTDYTRDGDFTLISPASGSYSTSTVEVQGQGEYGNTAVIFVNDEEAGRTDIAFDNSFNYTLQDLTDGDYSIYAKIVDQSELQKEISNVEKVTIDTTPPALVSITADPEKDIATGSKVTITVLSESELDQASIVFQDQVNTMTETSTSGKYQVDLVMPDKEGDYAMDVDLSDALGNEATYRDQLTITVGPSTETPASTAPEVGIVSGITATGGSEKVALSWETPESSTQIAYYRIYYGPSTDALFAISETYDASTTWSIPELIAKQEYYFAVTAVNVEGTEGATSTVIKAIPELSKEPAPVAEPTVPAITTSYIDITENPESGPATNILAGLSLIAALSYVLLRKRARA